MIDLQQLQADEALGQNILHPITNLMHDVQHAIAQSGLVVRRDVNDVIRGKIQVNKLEKSSQPKSDSNLVPPQGRGRIEAWTPKIMNEE